VNAETLALLAGAIRAKVRCRFTADTMYMLGNGQDVMLSVAEAGGAAEAVAAALEGAGLVVVPAPVSEPLTASPLGESAPLAGIRSALAEARYTDRPAYQRGSLAVEILLSLVESFLYVKPSMHGDHGPIPEECRFCEGEAAAITKYRDLVKNHLAVFAEDISNLEADHA
jgi:hypothetical protein